MIQSPKYSSFHQGWLQDPDNADSRNKAFLPSVAHSGRRDYRVRGTYSPWSCCCAFEQLPRDFGLRRKPSDQLILRLDRSHRQHERIHQWHPRLRDNFGRPFLEEKSRARNSWLALCQRKWKHHLQTIGWSWFSNRQKCFFFLYRRIMEPNLPSQAQQTSQILHQRFEGLLWGNQKDTGAAFSRAGPSGRKWQEGTFIINKIIQVAKGETDALLYLRAANHKWDSCAGEAIILALGGFFSDSNGAAIEYDPHAKSTVNQKGNICAIDTDLFHSIINHISKIW